MLFHRTTAKIIECEESVAELKKVLIGGIEQWILLRGKSKNNPVLLFLHGGPGSAQISVAKKYFSLLEQHFVVVNWDQRGAGLSYSRKISTDSMSIDNFINDTKEVIHYLLKRFHKQKIFLAGHSWGSLLGILVAHKFDKVIQAFVGIAQVVDMELTEKVIYTKLYQHAERTINRRVLDQLKKIGKPPYDNFIKSIKIRSAISNRFESEFKRKDILGIVSGFLVSSEYTLIDKLNFLNGCSFSFDLLKKDLFSTNLFELVPELKIPVYFFLSKHDYTAPAEIAEDYFDKLKAPYKEKVFFTDSTHDIQFDEPANFQKCLINKLLEHNNINQ